MTQRNALVISDVLIRQHPRLGEVRVIDEIIASKGDQHSCKIGGKLGMPTFAEALVLVLPPLRRVDSGQLAP